MKGGLLAVAAAIGLGLALAVLVVGDLRLHEAQSARERHADVAALRALIVRDVPPRATVERTLLFLHSAPVAAFPHAHRYDSLTIDPDYPILDDTEDAQAKHRAIDVRFERADDAKMLRALFLFDTSGRLQRYALSVFGTVM